MFSVSLRCISFDSYIKPQLKTGKSKVGGVVYLLIPTSNHNCRWGQELDGWVVYLLIPTSNHNTGYVANWFAVLYIFWFLHQTTTSPQIGRCSLGCISFDSYIKPQRRHNRNLLGICCISFDSYIKPQHWVCSQLVCCVVYLLIPTSNHNQSSNR